MRARAYVSVAPGTPPADYSKFYSFSLWFTLQNFVVANIYVCLHDLISPFLLFMLLCHFDRLGRSWFAFFASHGTRAQSVAAPLSQLLRGATVGTFSLLFPTKFP